MKRSVFGFFMLTMFFLAGCGSGNSKVTGTASYEDGTPLPRGILTISNASTQFTGEIIDGKFEMGGVSPKSGMPPGTYKVYVSSCFDENGKNLVKDDFTKADTTPLSLEVVKGKNPPLELKFEKAGK